MSIPGFLLLERGQLGVSAKGESWVISAGQEGDDVVPIDAATWGSRTDFYFNVNADRTQTGYAAQGMTPTGVGSHYFHPYGRKRITCLPPNGAFGLTLRNDIGSLVGNRLLLPDDKDVVLYEGDSFEIVNFNHQGNGWHMDRITRNLSVYEPAPVVLTGNVNDYFPTGWRRADQIHIGADADGRIISGFRALVSPLSTEQWLAHKYKKRIFNHTAFNVIYAHDDTVNESVDAQRIFTFSGADVTAEPGNIITVEYDQDADGGIGKWRLDA